MGALPVSEKERWRRGRKIVQRNIMGKHFYLKNLNYFIFKLNFICLEYDTEPQILKTQT